MISTELKTTIRGAYSRFLEAKSLKPRYGQRLMIAEIAKVLGDIDTDDEGRRSGDPAIVAVEAGTGTGKTVAYSPAAIPTAKLAGKRLVIATATVALQEQIVYKDLPDLMRNSGLNFSFATARAVAATCVCQARHALAGRPRANRHRAVVRGRRLQDRSRRGQSEAVHQHDRKARRQ